MCFARRSYVFPHSDDIAYGDNWLLYSLKRNSGLKYGRRDKKKKYREKHTHISGGSRGRRRRSRQGLVHCQSTPALAYPFPCLLFLPASCYCLLFLWLCVIPILPSSYSLPFSIPLFTPMLRLFFLYAFYFTLLHSHSIT